MHCLGIPHRDGSGAMLFFSWSQHLPYHLGRHQRLLAPGAQRAIAAQWQGQRCSAVLGVPTAPGDTSVAVMGSRSDPWSSAARVREQGWAQELLGMFQVT